MIVNALRLMQDPSIVCNFSVGLDLHGLDRDAASKNTRKFVSFGPNQVEIRSTGNDRGPARHLHDISLSPPFILGPEALLPYSPQNIIKSCPTSLDEPAGSQPATLGQCRICLDTLGEADIESGGGAEVVRLGCRCRSADGGSDLMHRSCAWAWFGLTRRSIRCEVCGADCVDMPQEDRLAIAR